MDIHLTPLLKLLLPAAIAAIILVRFRRREVLGPALIWPTARDAALFTFIYLAWMLATDAAMGWREPFDFAPWRAAPLSDSLFRVLGVCFAGPALEELVFRGVLFGMLLRTRLGGWGTVIVTAALWSVLHWSYTPEVILVIFVGGLILGAARLRTGSVLLAIMLHCLWNLYAVW